MLELLAVSLVLGIVVLGGLAFIGLISQPLLAELWSIVPGFIRWPVVGWVERQKRTYRLWQNKRELRLALGRSFGENRRLSGREVIEREALRKGICPECGGNVRGPGVVDASGLECPFHTES